MMFQGFWEQREHALLSLFRNNYTLHMREQTCDLTPYSLHLVTVINT